MQIILFSKKLNLKSEFDRELPELKYLIMGRKKNQLRCRK